MDKFVSFISDNYVWFLVITIVLLFALIGYFYDTRKNKYDLFKKNESALEDELKKYTLPEDKSINDMLNNNNENNDSKDGINLHVEETNVDE